MQITSFKNKTVAVLGLGRSGMATVRALIAGGADVCAWDDNADIRAACDAPMVDLTTCDWTHMAALVISPGIPVKHPAPHPVATLARDAGVEIIGDMELLARAGTAARIVGITGTNGKSTTTALIGHIFSAAGTPACVGGNIGVPVLDLEPLGGDATYVLELSSYQLDLTASLSCDIAVLLNIAPDHLDRHGGMDGYIAAKKKIFEMQGANDVAVIGVDDDASRALYESLKAGAAGKVIPVSGSGPVAGGIYVEDGILYDDGVEILPMAEAATLPGDHNAQNAAAAYAVARTAGIAPDVIAVALKSFPGLAHRQELVAIIDGISYVNDSKATNAEAASRALACYGNIYWIAGGIPKDGGIDAVTPHLGHVRHAYLIGEAANDFHAALQPHVPCEISGELGTAVGAARLTAISDNNEDPVVLLSPASASFDQFRDFEARGEAFRSFVEALPGVRGEGMA